LQHVGIGELRTSILGDFPSIVTRVSGKVSKRAITNDAVAFTERYLTAREGLVGGVENAADYAFFGVNRQAPTADMLNGFFLQAAERTDNGGSILEFYAKNRNFSYVNRLSLANHLFSQSRSIRPIMQTLGHTSPFHTTRYIASSQFIHGSVDDFMRSGFFDPAVLDQVVADSPNVFESLAALRQRTRKGFSDTEAFEAEEKLLNARRRLIDEGIDDSNPATLIPDNVSDAAVRAVAKIEGLTDFALRLLDTKHEKSLIRRQGRTGPTTDQVKEARKALAVLGDFEAPLLDIFDKYIKIIEGDPIARAMSESFSRIFNLIGFGQLERLNIAKLGGRPGGSRGRGAVTTLDNLLPEGTAASQRKTPGGKPTAAAKRAKSAQEINAAASQPIALGETRSIGSRGVTIVRAADVTAKDNVVLFVKATNGNEWSVVLDIRGERLHGSVLRSLVSGEVPAISPGNIQPLSSLQFNSAEVRSLLREIAQLFPDSKSVSGIRETVGRRITDRLQEIDLEPFRRGPSQAVVPSALEVGYVVREGGERGAWLVDEWVRDEAGDVTAVIVSRLASNFVQDERLVLARFANKQKISIFDFGKWNLIFESPIPASLADAAAPPGRKALNAADVASLLYMAGDGLTIPRDMAGAFSMRAIRSMLGPNAPSGRRLRQNVLDPVGDRYRFKGDVVEQFENLVRENPNDYGYGVVVGGAAGTPPIKPPAAVAGDSPWVQPPSSNFVINNLHKVIRVARNMTQPGMQFTDSNLGYRFFKLMPLGSHKFIRMVVPGTFAVGPAGKLRWLFDFSKKEGTGIASNVGHILGDMRPAFGYGKEGIGRKIILRDVIDGHPAVKAYKAKLGQLQKDFPDIWTNAAVDRQLKEWSHQTEVRRMSTVLQTPRKDLDLYYQLTTEQLKLYDYYHQIDPQLWSMMEASGYKLDTVLKIKKLTPEFVPYMITKNYADAGIQGVRKFGDRPTQFKEKEYDWMIQGELDEGAQKGQFARMLTLPLTRVTMEGKSPRMLVRSSPMPTCCNSLGRRP